jgi:hypothetical protein
MRSTATPELYACGQRKGSKVVGESPGVAGKRGAGYFPGMPIQVVPFEIAEKGVTVVHVTGTDGKQYEVRVGVMVNGVIDLGQKNPLDDMPIFNLQANMVSATKLKT